MNDLTPLEKINFDSARICHIFEMPFTDTDKRVRDYCHFTGKRVFIFFIFSKSLFINKNYNFYRYRGPAHNKCKLSFQDSRTIPIVFQI